MAPKNTKMPYVVVTLVSSAHAHHMGAASGVHFPRLQVNGYAASRLVAKDLKNKIRLAADGFRGDVTVDGNTFTFKRCDMTEDNDEFVQPVPGESDNGVREISLDFMTSAGETTPTF